VTSLRHDWDARSYDLVSAPQVRWGGPVAARLPLAGDELVLDAGCGTGRVTEAVLDRLPRGRVIGLDGSARMVEEARRRLGKGEGRLAFMVGDLSRRLPVAPGRLDAIVSTATLHWLPDHDALFHNLAEALRQGGRLEAQCGGAGNIASVTEALERVAPDEAYPYTFATPEETAGRLEAAGFTEIDTWLVDEHTPFPSREELESFLATVILWPQLKDRDRSEHAAFVARVVDELPALELDYVRLNLRAVRG
jgi:trans-aconitate 2-methyltransferase